MGGPSQQKVDMKEVKEKQSLARSQLLRQGFGYLPELAFKQRLKYFAAKVSTVISGKGILPSSKKILGRSYPLGRLICTPVAVYVTLSINCRTRVCLARSQSRNQPRSRC